ncbi:MAG: 2TM domain-containing protein [Hydrogenophaga sp.]|uniref:2TM domain-containing protein n=1 Tax=Hydrogenophaga sp. TaxID=1904254 RepID=UPI00261AA11F|nr:2TM domain-containing protein [Hydrogenophaga sp.]MDM7941911.1 2TM domain-containing protein [Hydrogenophaga sp.]
MNMHPQHPASESELDRIARRRVGARMGWYVHALVYLAVNTALMGISLASGRHWAIYPALGWGLGLLMHGVGVWVALGGGGLQARLVAQERERLDRERQGL